MTKDDILYVEKRLYKAIKESNIEVLDELLHKDLLFVSPNGEIITKEIDLKTYRDGNLKIDELHAKMEDINIIEDTAVITLTLELIGNYNTQPFKANYRYIRFWKNFFDGIKVVGGSGIKI